MDRHRKSRSNAPVTPPQSKKSRSRTRGTESNMNVIPETPEQSSPPTPKRRINFNQSSMDKFVSFCTLFFQHTHKIENFTYKTASPQQQRSPIHFETIHVRPVNDAVNKSVNTMPMPISYGQRG